MADSKQWQRLTAERKFRIFLETRRPDAPVGEILRKYGLTLEDLRAIEEAVESSAIAGLKVRAGHRKPMGPPSAEEHEQLCRELREKERIGGRCHFCHVVAVNSPPRSYDVEGRCCLR